MTKDEKTIDRRRCALGALGHSGAFAGQGCEGCDAAARRDFEKHIGRAVPGDRSPEASTLKVGDRVTTSDVGTVVAVDGKEVMVRWDGDGEPDDWVRREELRRADRTDYPMPAWAEDAEGDAKLPEDAAIKAAFPTRSGRHDLYGEAMRLVGARRSKAGLVSLVTWLLLRAGGGAK